MILMQLQNMAESSYIEIHEYTPLSQLGEMNNVVEIEMATFQLPSISISVYNINEYISSILDATTLDSVFAVRFYDTKRENWWYPYFAGYIDNKTTKYNPKNNLITFIILSYRAAAKNLNANTIYDRVYTDIDDVEHKIWYRFLDTRALFDKLYIGMGVEINNTYIDKFIYYDPTKKYLSFRSKDNFSVWQNSYNAFMYEILKAPDGSDNFAIFVLNGYFYGTFEKGFKYIEDAWQDAPTAIATAKNVSRWDIEELSSVATVYSRHEPAPVNYYYYSYSDVNYSFTPRDGYNLVELALAITGNNFQFFTAVFRYKTGATWGSWENITGEGSNDLEAFISFPKQAVWCDGTYFYTICRSRQGEVSGHIIDAQDLTVEYLLYPLLNVEPLPSDRSNPFYDPNNPDDPDNPEFIQRIWGRQTANFINTDIRKYLLMMIHESNQLVVYDVTNPNPTSGAVYDMNDKLNGGWLNVESITYDHSTGNYYSLVLKSDKTLAVYIGAPWSNNFVELEALYTFPWGVTRDEDSDEYDAIEISFRGVNMENWKDTYGDHLNEAYQYDEFRKFFERVRFCVKSDGYLAGAMILNNFSNGTQFFSYNNHAEVIIPNSDYTNKTISDALTGLAKTSRAIEWVDANKDAFAFDRQTLLPTIYHMYTGNGTVLNYGLIDDARQENLDFGASDSFTIECYCNLLTDTVSGNHFLAGKLTSVGGAAGMYRIYTDSGGYIKAQISDGSNVETATSIISILGQGLKYIAVVIDRVTDTMRIRINNEWVCAPEDISSVGSLENTGIFIVGRNHIDASAIAWEGYIRELRISNRLLSIAELSDNYKEMNGWLTDVYTVGHWNFNNQSGADETTVRNFLIITQNHALLYVRDSLRGFNLSGKYLDQYLLTEAKTDLLWKNIYRGVRITYDNGVVEVGTLFPETDVLNISVDNITSEAQAQDIANSYYAFVSIQRKAINISIVNFIPALFEIYSYQEQPYLCMEVTTNQEQNISTCIFAEIN